MNWKASFTAGEKFKIKEQIFELANVGNRSLILRRIAVKPGTAKETTKTDDAGASENTRNS